MNKSAEIIYCYILAIRNLYRGLIMNNNKKTAAIVSLYGNSNFGNKLQNYAVQEILKKEGLNTVNIVNVPCLNNNKVNHTEVIKLYIKGWFRYILKGDKRIILSEICLQHGGEHLKVLQIFAGYFYYHFIQQ